MFIRSPKELGIVVRDRRKRLKMSQVMAADLVGIKQSTFSAFENKPEAAKLDTLFRILAAVGLEIHVNERGIKISEQEPWKEEW